VWEPLWSLFGPVIIDPRDTMWFGAGEHTNNTAELTAIGETFCWILNEAPGVASAPATIFYDSEYAAGAILGKFEPGANLQLIRQCQMLLAELSKSRLISWTHVCGHAARGYIQGNFWADVLAAKGVRNEVSSHSRRWAATAITQENILLREICRKCGKVLSGAQSLAAHERLQIGARW
jgi:ribonuclease HI